MLRLVYISVVNDGADIVEIDGIVEQAVRNNCALEISGVLLFNGLNFLQVLEGPAKQVHMLFDRSRGDRRHVSVVTVLIEPITERVITGWGMVLKTRPAISTPSRAAQRHMADILSLDLPAHVRRIIENFDMLQG